MGDRVTLENPYPCEGIYIYYPKTKVIGGEGGIVGGELNENDSVGEKVENSPMIYNLKLSSGPLDTIRVKG